MKRYVAGFLFNNQETRVVLICKTKPVWQNGLWNGVGGKIEGDELPVEAMRREFLEETGVNIEDYWEPFCTLNGPDFTVHFFSAHEDDQVLDSVESLTEEKVAVHNIDELKTLGTIPNVQWLIPMALSMWDDNASSFEINEQHKTIDQVQAHE